MKDAIGAEKRGFCILWTVQIFLGIFTVSVGYFNCNILDFANDFTIGVTSGGNCSVFDSCLSLYGALFSIATALSGLLIM